MCLPSYPLLDGLKHVVFTRIPLNAAKSSALQIHTIVAAAASRVKRKNPLVNALILTNRL